MREEIVAVALDLFAATNYEATTVDDIATAAGISRRTFFRYFASKDEVVLGKFEQLGAAFVEGFGQRPPDEDVWTSLRRSFDVTAGYFDDPQLRSRSETIEAILARTPALAAAQLEKVSRSQEDLVRAVASRIAGTDAGTDAADLQARVVVGAAFACLAAARTSWVRAAGERPFAEVLDEAMDALRPNPRGGRAAR